MNAVCHTKLLEGFEMSAHFTHHSSSISNDGNNVAILLNSKFAQLLPHHLCCFVSGKVSALRAMVKSMIAGP